MTSFLRNSVHKMIVNFVKSFQHCPIKELVHTNNLLQFPLTKPRDIFGHSCPFVGNTSSVCLHQEANNFMAEKGSLETSSFKSSVMKMGLFSGPRDPRLVDIWELLYSLLGQHDYKVFEVAVEIQYLNGGYPVLNRIHEASHSALFKLSKHIPTSRTITTVICLKRSKLLYMESQALKDEAPKKQKEVKKKNRLTRHCTEYVHYIPIECPDLVHCPKLTSMTN